MRSVRSSALMKFLILLLSLVAFFLMVLVSVHAYKLWHFLATNVACSSSANFGCYVINALNVLSEKLYAWQSLSAALLALGAALLGVFAVFYQTHATEKLEKERESRRAEALRRGLLPFSMARLADFCEEQATSLIAILPEAPIVETYEHEPSDTWKRFFKQKHFGEIQEDLIQILEFSHSNHQINLAKICEKIQVYAGRKRDLENPDLPKSRSAVLDLAAHIAELKARSEKMLSIAREPDTKLAEMQSSNVTKADIMSAAFLLNFSMDYIIQLERHIEL